MDGMEIRSFLCPSIRRLYKRQGTRVSARAIIISKVIGMLLKSSKGRAVSSGGIYSLYRLNREKQD